MELLLNRREIRGVTRSVPGVPRVAVTVTVAQAHVGRPRPPATSGSGSGWRSCPEKVAESRYEASPAALPQAGRAGAAAATQLTKLVAPSGCPCQAADAGGRGRSPFRPSDGPRARASSAPTQRPLSRATVTGAR